VTVKALFAAATLALLCGWAVPGSAALNARQMQLLQQNCVQCHATETAGAPLIGRRDDWRDALVRGEEAMLVNTVQGLRGMPPLGYCSSCSEADFRALIRFMAGVAEPAHGGAK
jgi:cytochrome c5